MLLRLVGDHRVEESKVAVRKPEGVAPVTIPVEGGNAHPAPLASVFQLGYKARVAVIRSANEPPEIYGRSARRPMLQSLETSPMRPSFSEWRWMARGLCRNRS